MSLTNQSATVLVKAGKFYSAYSNKLVIDMIFEENSPYTDQSFKDECDINTIMARYQSTGELPVLNGTEAQWLDVTEMDFQTHMDFMIQAQEMFDALPSDVRDRFGNDPGAFLGFCSDAENHKELAKMGLLTPEATERLLYPPDPPQPSPKEPPVTS